MLHVYHSINTSELINSADLGVIPLTGIDLDSILLFIKWKASTIAELTPGSVQRK